MAKSVLPDSARVLPKAGQGVWIKAFQEAKNKGLPDDEASAFAWAAVKRAGYSKLPNGKWGKSMEAGSLIVENDEFMLGVPFVKINASNRTVSGFATLDNIDQAGDIVDFGASQEAFSKWIGNIREMHQKTAVGKALEITEKQYTKDGEVYNGIWITAKISKGAEDTWQKVLDGTLCGFSIGGAVYEKEKTTVKSGDSDRDVWLIKNYALNEVSLVDNPCNHLATVSLVKSVDGSLVYDEDIIEDGGFEKGYTVDGFADLSDPIKEVVRSLEAYRDAAISVNDDDAVACAANYLSTFRRKGKYEETDAKYHAEHANKSIDGGGTEEVPSAVVKDSTSDKEETTMEKELQENENSDTSSVEVLEANERSVLKSLTNLIFGKIEPEAQEPEGTEKEGDVTSDMNVEEVKELVDGTVEEINKSVDEKFEQIGTSLASIAEALEAVAKSEALDELKKELEDKIAEVTERLEVVETSGGVQKSGDATASNEKIEKGEGSLWSDSIVPEFLRKQA